MLDSAKTQETLLEVNNIEVIYNHVILVLKGVSLSVPKGGITATPTSLVSKSAGNRLPDTPPEESSRWSQSAAL